MRKSHSSLILFVAALFLLPTSSFAKLKVIASITPLQSLTESVGGDLVDVQSIGRGNEDPHFVEVRPSFIMAIGNAQLYISVGMSLDHWAKPLIENSRNDKIMVVNASQGLQVEGVPTERVSPLMGDVHPEGNPHYWVDPYNAPVIVKNIMNGLIAVDPSHKDTYQKNAQAFLSTLKVKTAEWLKDMAPYKGTKVVTYHESWEYFAKRFGLDVVGQEEPKPGVPPSGAHTEEIIELIQRDKVPLIIQETYYSDSTSKMIASRTGAKVAVIPQLCGGVPGTSSYIELMDHDVKAVVAALKK